MSVISGILILSLDRGTECYHHSEWIKQVFTAFALFSTLSIIWKIVQIGEFNFQRKINGGACKLKR